jgi:hypothetical protein
LDDRLGRRNPQLGQYLDRTFARGFAIKAQVHHRHFVNLAANVADRVKGSHRVLGDEGNAAPAQFAKFSLRALKGMTVEGQIPTSDATAYQGQKTHDRHGRQRLSGPAFADQPVDLPPIQRKTDPVQRRYTAD